jgi:hypothetical protein
LVKQEVMEMDYDYESLGIVQIKHVVFEAAKDEVQVKVGRPRWTPEQRERRIVIVEGPIHSAGAAAAISRMLEGMERT